MTTYTVVKPLSIAIVLCMLAMTGCGGSEQRQEKYFERAQTYFDNENLEKATIEVKNVLQINPNHADARFLLGMIAETNKDYRAAFGNFSAAVDIDPAHIKSLNKLANYFLLSKNADSALEKINMALEIDANNADTLAALSMFQLNEKENEKAIESAQKALSISPGHVQATTVLTAIYAKDDPEMALKVIEEGIANQSENESLRMLKIRVLETQNKPDDVILQYKELINQYPNNLFYPYQLVNFYLKDTRKEQDDRNDLAESTLRDLVTKKPDNEQVKLWLVEFLIRNRGREQGQQMLETFLKDAPENFTLRDSLAKIHVSAGQSQKAIGLYNHVIDSDPKGALSIEARNRLIVLALSEKRRKDADELLIELFDIEPENVQALITRAKLKMLDGDIKEAIPDLRVVIKNEPESVQALLLLAKAHEKNKAMGLALDNYKRVVSVQPGNLEALTGAARLLISSNQFDEAIPFLESALKINAINPEAALLLTGGYVKTKQWDKALAVAARLTENENTMAMGHYLQGSTYLRKQDIPQALLSLKKSLEIDPRIVESLTFLVQGYVAQDEKEKAITYLQAHVNQYPDHAHARELLATLHARVGNTDKAIAAITSLINESPERTSAYRVLAQIYASQNKVDAIEVLYKKGIERKPDNATLKVLLAEFYQTTERYQEAVDLYQSILLERPNALVVRNNLASLLMDYFSNEQSITRVAQLIEGLGSTDNPAFLDTAGWAHFHMGNYPQAIALLTAAIEKGGKGAVFHYHLGMAFYKSAMKEQAKKHLQLATSDEKSHYVGKEEALDILKTL